MPKAKQKPQTIRISVSFPDCRLLRVLVAHIRGGLGKGEPINLASWIREAIRMRLKREGVRCDDGTL